MKDSDPNYETYYYKINSSGSWVDYKNVTDYTVDEVGGFPSIAVSDNRVHVGYNTKGQDNPLIGIGTAKIRTKEGANWLAPEIIVENISFIERVYADNTYLYDFYYENYFGRGDIYVKKRELNGSTWTEPTLLHLGGDQLSLISAATHSTGKLRVVYSQPGVHFYREFSGNWTEPFELGNGFGANMSSVYNDLFVIFHNNGIISYRQCDEAPAPPQNLTVTSYNGHPKLTWNRNVDPDIKQYRIYKKKETSNFELIGSVSKNTLEFVDSDELVITDPPSHQMGIVPAYYKIKARDNGNKDSEFSNQVTSWVYSELPQISWFTNGETVINEFTLDQNYPNPFNPSTNIEFVLPERSNVVVKVFDALGREIETLANGSFPSGRNVVSFNASNLSSGIYYYRVSTENYISTKKMMLMK